MMLVGVDAVMDGNPEFSQPAGMFPDSEFIDLISRDAESFPGPIAFGHKYITGGAGEGDQQLHPDGSFEHREQVKSDSVLPAYCEPPNPCPVGYSAEENGCLEEFDNSADFSRNYQSQQQCLCDQEHMFNCPSKNTEEYEEGLEEMLSKNGLHKSMIAKKFHEKRPDEPRRKKRSPEPAPNHHQKHQEAKHYNRYWADTPLRNMVKKNGKNIDHM